MQCPTGGKAEGTNVESGEKPLQVTLGKRPGLKSLRYGLLLAVSIATLSGCVSAISNDMRADAGADSIRSLAEEESGATTGTVPSKGDGGQNAEVAVLTPASASQADENRQADMAGAVMQPTGLNAGQSSIYSNGGDAVNRSTPAYTSEGGSRNAAVNSIYSGAVDDTASGGRLPVEDMPRTDANSRQILTVPDDEQSSLLPDNVPIPTTARTALVDDKAARNAAEYALEANAETAARAMVADQTKAVPADGGGKRMTLASLFSGKRPASAQLATDSETTTTRPRQVLNRDSAAATRKASLGVSNLPGVSVTGLPGANDHSESDEAVEDDGPPQFKEVASLAGLARLAPNGLWLQTEKVRTGCFKPELLSVLKTVEKHYGKPIIVTSGLRDVKRARAKQSLHTRCEAADIQIAGVTKWELAEYLRTMPGRGGVGTYCHTESVHIDIGAERDWNWNCRKK